ncbi:MAG TPA: protein kinase [Gemmataceae bacterium]|jgi:serine/threonine protein kinase
MGADLSDCPSARVLGRLLADELAGPDRESVEAHVEACAGCQGQLEKLVATQMQPAAVAVGPREPDMEPGRAFLSRLQGLSPPAAGTWRPTPAAVGDPARPERGRLGQYEILGKLGRGGMGAVYKARHTELGKVVALKVLPAEQMDEVSIARFKNEVRAIGKLDHPNIVVAHDAGEADGVHFLVMELVDGMDLARVVDRRGRLPVAEACEAVRQAAVGLQHAYERGLVHRDVKPPNLMLARDGRVRLLDLGLARSFGEAAAATLTAQGVLLGTADYLAPEQWDQPHAADTRSDIYSLGCTLYHLLTGHPPFGGGPFKSLPSKMRAHREVPPPPLGPYCPEAPPGLVAVLNRMLAKDPAERFATPAEVAAALRPFTPGADLVRLLDASDATARPRAVPVDAATPAPGAWETGPDRRTGRRPDPPRPRAVPAVLAGLGLLLAVGLVARPWFPGAPGEPDGPLVVKDLHVEHYRGKGEDATRIGDLWTSPAPVRLNDYVQVLGKLSRPAHYYLIAFNPQGSQDGTVQLCQPEGEKGKGELVRPGRQTGVEYPRGTEGFQVDAVGLQAFVLAASVRPLPPFKEWRDKAETIPWEGVKDGGKWRWHFDGRDFLRYPRERGRVVPLAGNPNPLRILRDFFTRQPIFDVVQIVAFPVVDDEK